MMKRIALSVTVLLILALTGTALAQGPVSPTHSDPSWRASYWNNATLYGAPVLERQEADLFYDWGAGSPDPGISTDRFSARWTKYIYVTGGDYRFTATSDDGVRLWVDGHLIINEWHDHPATTFSAQKSLSSGHHQVVIEYYENQGLAVFKFDWGPVAPVIRGWRSEYWNNAALSGAPALVRDEMQINYDWGTGSPAPTIHTDDFSARWSRDVYLPAGRYRFTVTVDDGVRLWVNNQLLIESWRDQPATTYTGEIDLPDGNIPIKMEYYEHGGLATAKMSWEKIPPAIYNWRGEYFNNLTLSGTPALVRDDASIHFDWGTGSPAPSVIGSDGFSVRWTRTQDFPAGRYRFAATVDDGVRLWVNGHLLIEAWRDQAATTYTEEIYLSGGTIPIKMEYYENGGRATAQLSWDPVSEPPSDSGVVVDDTDPGFSKGGRVASWRTVYEGYGNRLLWTWNNDWQQPDFNWARWTPSLSPGRYEVFVYVPYRYTTTASARYLVSHSGGFTSRVVDQDANGDRWVSLGTYWFNGTSNDYVYLTDATGERRLTRLVAFDAVKWVPR